MKKLLLLLTIYYLLFTIYPVPCALCFDLTAGTQPTVAMLFGENKLLGYGTKLSITPAKFISTGIEYYSFFANKQSGIKYAHLFIIGRWCIDDYSAVEFKLSGGKTYEGIGIPLSTDYSIAFRQMLSDAGKTSARIELGRHATFWKDVSYENTFINIAINYNFKNSMYNWW